MIGNLGMWEIMLIFLLVLLLFGAKRIPEIAGSMGKGIRAIPMWTGTAWPTAWITAH